MESMRKIVLIVGQKKLKRVNRTGHEALASPHSEIIKLVEDAVKRNPAASKDEYTGQDANCFVGSWYDVEGECLLISTTLIHV